MKVAGLRTWMKKALSPDVGHGQRDFWLHADVMKLMMTAVMLMTMLLSIARSIRLHESPHRAGAVI